MTLTLENFKRTIPSTILTRGRDYYRNGNVSDLSLEGDDTWMAEVEGTEPYEIRIVQKPDQSLECSCTCPYEFGEHCKHIAAVLYAIEEAFPEYFNSGRRKPARKRVTRMDRLRAALQSIPPEQLVGVLLKIAEDDRDLQTQLLLRLDTGDAPADYRRLVKDSLRPLRSNHGFTDFRTASRVIEQLDEIFGRADRMLPTRPENALTIYQIVLEESMAIAGRVDDSNGVLADAIPRALDGLETCAERLSPDGRAALFDYCLREAAKPQFEGWGYRWSLFELAADLVETPVERDALYAALKPFEVVPKKDYGGPLLGDYRAETIAAIQLKVVERLEGGEAALNFINDHRHLPSFRQILIQHHVAQGDLASARTLAEEGLAATQKDNFRYGLALNYRDLILQIAQLQGDNKAAIEHARALWLSRHSDTYYELLTDLIPPDKWADFRACLLNDRACPRDLAAWAYAREGMWLEVRDIALADRQLLTHYQLEIEARFPHETAAAYRRFADKLLTDVSNRSTYREAAGYLVRMQKLGHGDEGKALARSYIEKYPQRRAMIEELKRATV